MKRAAFIILLTVWFPLSSPVDCPATGGPKDPGGTQEPGPGQGVGDWKSIRVLDLETAQRIARRKNPSLGAAQDRVRQAREKVWQARSAYFPWIDGKASVSRVRLSENAYQQSLLQAQFFNPQATVQNPEDYYMAGVTASWLLFDGFAREFSCAVARYGEKGTHEAYLDALRLLLSSVATSYNSAQLAREDMAIAEADVAFNQRQAQEARARQRVGTGSLSDVLSFEVQVNAARAGRISARRAYETSLSALAALLGVPNAAFPSHVELARLGRETPEEMTPADPTPLLAYAMKHRTDILQGEFTLEQAKKEVGVARAQFLPSINLSASYEGERADTASFDSDDFGDALGVNFSYNLFAGGSSLARYREAKARRDEAKRILENQKLRVASEIQETIAQLKSTQEELRLQRSNAELVQKNRDLVEKEYEAGQASLVRLNEAQRNLIQAQSRLALALVSLRQAWFNLRTSTAQTLIPYRE